MSFNENDVDSCPLSEEETIEAASRLNCGVDENGRSRYVCVPNQDLTALVEFCYTKMVVGLYQLGHCLRAVGNGFLDQISCESFTEGCPKEHFRSTDLYRYPACHRLNTRDQCFVADPFCDSVTKKPTSTPVLGISNADADYNDFSEAVNLANIGVNTAVTISILVIIGIICAFWRRRTRNGCNIIPGLLIFWRNENVGSDDYELRNPIEKPKYISIGVFQLKARNILYVIGQLGNSVSTAGKEITKKYAQRYKMSCHYYSYLEVSDKFSELCPENVFKPRSVNFIDGWGGLWNENPCERRGTLETIAKIVEQSQKNENKKFVIGLRTEIREILRDELLRLDIRMSEHETVLLDSSSIYKRKKVKEEITLLQNSCSNDNCNCKSLNFEQVSGIVQVPIGIYLVVKLMALDHTMIPDFLREGVGPLKAIRDHFKGLMEGEQSWSWLPYFVCLGYYDEKEFKQEIADGFDISRDTLSVCERIAKYTKSMNKLAPMWSARFNLEKDHVIEPRNVLVFWHTFLYICAFHACFKKYPKQIMRFCNLDAILQLVRPKSRPDPLTIEADDEEIDFFCEERLKSLADDSVLLGHPLIQDWKSRKED